MGSCPHFAADEIPSCVALEVHVFRHVRDFLLGNTELRKSRLDFPLAASGCLRRDASTNSIEVVDKKCLGCGFCVAGCPSTSFVIDESLAPQANCGGIRTISSGFLSIVKQENVSSSVFRKMSGLLADANGEHLRSFAAFTSADEVLHLSRWAVRALTFLLGSTSEGAVEVNIPIEGKDRPGRLDVCVRSEFEMFVFESKKNFKEMMREGRVFDQYLDYQTEIDRILLDERPNRECHLMLLVGGDESDMFPPDHSECTAHDLDACRRFLNWLHRNNAKAVSAQGLLWLFYRKLAGLDEDPVALLKKLKDSDGNLVLTSRGYVVATGNDFNICDFTAGCI